MDDKEQQAIDKVRMTLDDLEKATLPFTKEEVAFVRMLVGHANDLLDVLSAATLRGPGGESASPASPAGLSMDSPSPLVTCDGVKECAMSNKAIGECIHSKPHKQRPMCTINPRCSNCPPPLGVCR
jgi:hypothetical protein